MKQQYMAMMRSSAGCKILACLAPFASSLIIPSTLVAQEAKLRAFLKGHTNMVSSVAYSPDGKTLASASQDHTVRLWETATNKELTTLQGHTNAVDVVAFSPDGMTLASGGLDKTVRLWEVATRKERAMRKGLESL
jgi:WD40 repeat protein